MTDTTDHPSRRAGLRDELVNALGRITTTPPVAHRRAQADHVLGVLYREWPWLRAEAEDAASVVVPAADRAAVCICGHTEQQHFEDACITEITGCDCGDFTVPEAAREVIDRWRKAATRKTADRAALLREAADRIDATREPFPIAVQNGITWATAELRRMAVEDAPLSPFYEHPECGFRWHGRDDMDIPMRDGQPVCPRCELRRLAAESAVVDRVAADTPPAETDALTPRCDHCRQPGHSFEDCPHADHGPAVEAQPGKDTETPQPKEA